MLGGWQSCFSRTNKENNGNMISFHDVRAHADADVNSRQLSKHGNNMAVQKQSDKADTLSPTFGMKVRSKDSLYTLGGDSVLISKESEDDTVDSIQLLGQSNTPQEDIKEVYDEEISDLKLKVYSKSDWIKVLKNRDLENTPNTELFVSLRHGIPLEMRPRIWEFLANTDKLKKRTFEKGLYSRLSNAVCSSEVIIGNDVTRTYTKNAFFKNPTYKGTERLRRILRAYANFDVEIGYTQGMNFIAAALLIIMHPQHYKSITAKYYHNYEEEYEEKVFWIFVHFMQDKNWRSIYCTGTPKVLEMTKFFGKMMKERVPEIHKKIIELELSVDIIFNEMFITLLLMHCPLALGKRILDLFFIEGEKIIFKVLIRSLMLSKARIMQCEDCQQLNDYIRKQMFDDLLEKYKTRLYVLFPFAEA